MNSNLGRHFFGLSAIYLGVCTLIWHDFIWQLVPALTIPHIGVLVDGIAVVEIGGGIAIQFPRFARAGASLLGIIYAICALLWLPSWIQKPLVFDSIGNFFEQFVLVAGTLVVYGPKTARIGYYGFGVSVISFALYQAVHMDVTSGLVPKWIPLGQMFWAIVTTIAFALAAASLLTGRMALLAARLTALMIAAFGLLIWVPACITDPRTVGNWSEMGLNFAICGSAWIVADYLARRHAASWSAAES